VVNYGRAEENLMQRRKDAKVKRRTDNSQKITKTRRGKTRTADERGFTQIGRQVRKYL
jgi:hypothetical protein